MMRSCTARVVMTVFRYLTLLSHPKLGSVDPRLFIVGIMKPRPAKNPSWSSRGRWIHWYGRDNTDVANLVPDNIPSLGINLVCFLHRISDRVRVYREHGPTFQEDTIMPFLARGNGFARVRGKVHCDGETKYNRWYIRHVNAGYYTQARSKTVPIPRALDGKVVSHCHY